MSFVQTPLSEPLRQTALSTIASFVDWVEFPTLLMEDAKLIKLLYTFIGVEDLKTLACQCLLSILSRKVHVNVCVCKLIVATFIISVFLVRCMFGQLYVQCTRTYMQIINLSILL